MTLKKNSKIRSDYYTDSNSIGSAHNENQDSFLADDENLLYVVADGVGGYRGAKEASSIAVEVIKSFSDQINDEKSLKHCVESIQKQIQQEGRRLGFWNMGTTLACAKILPETNTILTTNVGDSPILLCSRDSSKGLKKIYKDDSFRSEDPRSMWAMVQYLGLEDYDVEIHTLSARYEDGDVLVICSDGITDNLLQGDESGFLELVMKKRSAKELVEAAIEKGTKPDDMTAIILEL